LTIKNGWLAADFEADVADELLVVKKSVCSNRFSDKKVS
jgi:hypothetical protein